jgi:DNA processing protein
MALAYVPLYGNILIKRLIRDSGSAENAFSETYQGWQKLRKYHHGLSKPALSPTMWEKVIREYEWMEANQVKVSFFTDPEYPSRLRSCNDAPYLFFYRGDSNFNRQRVVSIVGTRGASVYGKDVVKKIVSELTPYGVSVVSGLARGIDTQAHEQALTRGLNTVAVLGSGLGAIYPRGNTRLAQQIVENGGTLLSEFPYMETPDRQNFPRRNRIIAGMSDAVIVAESARKGGSMITAFIAHSYNRDVFAVPGSVFQESFSGCHELIRSNVAAIVTSGDEFADMMGWNLESPKHVQRSLFIEIDEKEKDIADLILAHPAISIDELMVKLSGVSVSKIASILLSLEIKGLIECLPGKVYRWVR